MHSAKAATCTTAYVGSACVYCVTRQGSSQSTSPHSSTPKRGNAPSRSRGYNVTLESDGNRMFPTSIVLPEHQSGGGVVRLTNQTQHLRIQDPCQRTMGGSKGRQPQTRTGCGVEVFVGGLRENPTRSSVNGQTRRDIAGADGPMLAVGQI